MNTFCCQIDRKEINTLIDYHRDPNVKPSLSAMISFALNDCRKMIKTLNYITMLNITPDEHKFIISTFMNK